LKASLPDRFQWRADGELAWIETALPGGRAAFSTRLGGLSEGSYASLNLGILTDDDPDLVAGNRARLALALERDPDAVAMGWQVHGADIARHTHPPAPSGYARRGSELARVDGQATDRLDVTPIVLTADCVPLALGAPGATAMVHCGWRGVAAGIVTRGVEACCELAGVSVDEVGAALGPGIGGCCYRIGAEVRSAFQERGHGSDVLVSVAGELSLDLPLAIRHELEKAGLATQRIADTGLCTSCNAGLFFSHRRDDGVTGRQAGLAWRDA
jgi:polyphenol oxidase